MQPLRAARTYMLGVHARRCGSPTMPSARTFRDFRGEANYALFGHRIAFLTLSGRAVLIQIFTALDVLL